MADSIVGSPTHRRAHRLDTPMKPDELFAGAAGGSIALHTSGCSPGKQSAEQQEGDIL